MSDFNEPYHNKGFAPAFLWIIFIFFVLPSIAILSIDSGWSKYVAMRGFSSDCWENSKHERVCKKENTCMFLRNFCTEEVYRWKAN